MKIGFIYENNVGYNQWQALNSWLYLATWT